MIRWARPLFRLGAHDLAALALMGFSLLVLPLRGGLEWGSPAAFWLVVPVLLLPLQRGFTGANRLAVAQAGKRRWSIRLLFAWMPEVLRVGGLLLLVLALARPRITHRDVVVESQGLDIMLAIDTSGSMRAEDMATGIGVASRLAVAKGVAAEFVKGRPNDRVGVVVFGEEAFTHVPLTLDHDTLGDVLETLDLGMAGSRGTAVGTAIAVAAKRMKDLPAPERVIILVTDGRSNAGRLSPIDAAKAAGALGIRVYTIGIGAPPSMLGAMMGDGIDEDMMKEVASLTGGQYFRATNLQNLEDVYKTINALETSPAKVKELVEHEELYPNPLMAGLLWLAVSMWLSSTWLRRGP